VGAAAVAALLAALAKKVRAPADTNEAQPRPPRIVVAVDQAEELFLAEGASDDDVRLVRDLAAHPASNLIVIATIRSDTYERLQRRVRMIWSRSKKPPIGFECLANTGANSLRRTVPMSDFAIRGPQRPYAAANCLRETVKTRTRLSAFEMGYQKKGNFGASQRHRNRVEAVPAR